MKKMLGLIICAAITGFYSCSTDFDVNAPAEDITVVFGLLDKNETQHYIRISKAFLGEQNALVMAKDPANSSYGDALNVIVEEYTNGDLTNTFACSKTIVANKEEGIFYNPYQEIYVFSGNLSVNSIYRVVIENKETGKQVTAETGLISDFSIEKPSQLTQQIGFVNTNGSYSTANELKWYSAKNGRLYEPLFRFHYKEVDLTTSDTVNKSVDWKMTSVKSDDLNGGETMLMNYNGESFYQFLKFTIPVDYNKYRIVGKIDFMLSLGGDELSTYIDLNRPSNTIIQERPAYTNVSNGIGIFSCRLTKSHDYFLSPASVEELINGAYTSNLGFHQ